MCLQRSGNRRTAYVMPEVLQRTSDSRIPSGRILLRHPHDQPPDLREDARTARSARRARPLARDELAMPAQDRIGRDNRRNLAQHTSAQTLPAPRETAPLFVGYPQSSATKLTPQSTLRARVATRGSRVAAPLASAARLARSGGANRGRTASLKSLPANGRRHQSW